MKKTFIRMTEDIIMLIVPLMAFVWYVVGFSITNSQGFAAMFVLAGALVGLIMVAVFEKAVEK
jgi:sorbitol-specific phosphotransferase system component IIBC